MLKDIDVVIPVCYLIEYGNNHSKTSRNLWQYFNDEPILITLLLIFLMIIIVKKFCLNLNQKIRDETGVSGTEDVEMINRLNYLSNFWIIFTCH